MTIYLDNIGKRYRENWVFKGLSYTFEAGKKYALLGQNGSGKSTLLRIVAGMQHANKGTVRYVSKQCTLPPEKIFQHISYCAPAMDLVEEMTLAEFLKFHFTFKKMLPGVSCSSLIQEMDMEDSGRKMIHEFSSGMKQRVKLAQAFFADTPVLLLDEPCSNLDTQGIHLYQRWITQYTHNRTVIIASNDEREYRQQVSASVFIEDYSGAKPPAF